MSPLRALKAWISAHSCTIKIPRTIPATTPAEKISSISFISYAFRKLLFFWWIRFGRNAKRIPRRKVWKTKHLGRVAGWQLARASCQIVNDWKNKSARGLAWQCYPCWIEYLIVNVISWFQLHCMRFINQRSNPFTVFGINQPLPLNREVTPRQWVSTR